MTTEAALAARRRATEAAIKRVHDAITRLRREKTQVSVAAVARRAGVSRTFLYGNPDARTAVATAITAAGERRVQMLAAQDDEQEATWRERALNAEDALKTAHAEITTQRTRIGELLGQVRDLESEWTKEAIARITTENTTLKQRVRQLTADNRTLEERLAAARSNNRFADRRIAQLEAELATPPGTQEIPLCLPWTPQTPSSSPSCCSSSATGWNPTTTTSPPPSSGSSAARPTAPPHCARTSPVSGSSSVSPTATACSPQTSRNHPAAGKGGPCGALPANVTTRNDAERNRGVASKKALRPMPRTH